MVETAPDIFQHLPNGGAVAAVITITWIFLKRQEKTEESVKGIVQTFANEVAASRKEYRDHVDAIMHMGLNAHQETRAAIGALTATLGGLRDDRDRASEATAPKKPKEPPR